jgi:hypothetical protein
MEWWFTSTWSVLRNEKWENAVIYARVWKEMFANCRMQCGRRIVLLLISRRIHVSSTWIVHDLYFCLLFNAPRFKSFYACMSRRCCKYRPPDYNENDPWMFVLERSIHVRRRDAVNGIRRRTPETRASSRQPAWRQMESIIWYTIDEVDYTINAKPLVVQCHHIGWQSLPWFVVCISSAW